MLRYPTPRDYSACVYATIYNQGETVNRDKVLGLLYACNHSGECRGSRLYTLARKLEEHYVRPAGFLPGYYDLQNKFVNYTKARAWAAHYVRMIRGPR
jgi:hypothetical protein